MDRQSRGWGFESPIQPFNFQMLKEFVLISFIKPDVRKTLNKRFNCFNLQDDALYNMLCHETNIFAGFKLQISCIVQYALSKNWQFYLFLIAI